MTTYQTLDHSLAYRIGQLDPFQSAPHAVVLGAYPGLYIDVDRAMSRTFGLCEACLAADCSPSDATRTVRDVDGDVYDVCAHCYRDDDVFRDDGKFA